jgi:hypothetical protein
LLPSRAWWWAKTMTVMKMTSLRNLRLG